MHILYEFVLFIYLFLCAYVNAYCKCIFFSFL